MAFTRELLSGSTDGMGIKVVATATAGTAVHTAHATAKDEVWVWAFNSDTSTRTLTVEFGDATAPDHNIVVDVPPKAGVISVVPGFVLTNGKTVKAFASAANVVTVSGYVNRLT